MHLDERSDNPSICRCEDSKKMSRVCEKCGKAPMAGHNVSHSHLKTKRRFLPNLQSFQEAPGKKRIKVCATCLKTMSKVK